MSEKWPIESILPHRGSMLFLDRVVSYGSDWIVCEADTAKQALFAQTPKGIPAWFGLEYMCQSIAALEGIKCLEKNASVRLSYVMGSRRICSELSHLPFDETLTIRADTEIRDESAIGVFNCKVFAAERCIMQGMIKGYMPKSPDLILQAR